MERVALEARRRYSSDDPPIAWETATQRDRIEARDLGSVSVLRVSRRGRSYTLGVGSLLARRAPSSEGVALRTRWRVYQGFVVVGWLGAAFVLAGALGDWMSLDVWLAVSIWMICVMLLAPISNRLLRAPVSLFEGDVDPRHRALPMTLRPALRGVLTDARTLRLTLDSKTVDLDALSTDLWRWVRDLEGLSEMDAAVIRERGLDVGPIRRALEPESEGADRRCPASDRATVIQWLERFDDELSAYRDGLYR